MFFSFQTHQIYSLPCVPGKHQDATKQNSCKACEANTFTEVAEQETCKACPNGKMSGQGSASCNLCPSGKAGATTCENCLVGEFRAGGTGDGTSCDSCPKGSYQSQEGQGSW